MLVAVLVALSPEVGEIVTRMSHADPCELREVPLARTFSALEASAPWRRYRRHLVTERPVDVWREGCWRFMVFPAVLGSRRVEMVFAVYLAGRRAPVRVGMLDVAPGAAEVWHAPAADSTHKRDEDEDITVHPTTVAEARAMVARGDIVDLKTAYALALI